MKYNTYDLFDYYDAEKNGLPQVQEMPIAEGTVHARVMERTGISTGTAVKRRRFRLTKWTAAVAAAVVLVTGGTMTATAGFGGLDHFFQSLFTDEAPKSPEKMENLVTMPCTAFDSTNEDVQFTLLGMYGDDSQAMLSFEITTSHGTIIASDDWSTWVKVTTTRADGTVETLSYDGETCGLKKSNAEDDIYDLNLVLKNAGLQGKTIDITFQNFYTPEQQQAVYDQVVAFDDALQKDYITQTFGEDAMDGLEEDTLPTGFDVDAWKAYRQEQNYDQLIAEKYEQYYTASETALVGTWHTAIAMDFVTDEPIAASYADGTIQLQTLSAQISYPKAFQDSTHSVEYYLTLKDGRKIATEYRIFEDLIDPQSGLAVLTEDYVNANTYVDFGDDNAVETVVICYDEPIAPQDIAAITMVPYEFDSTRTGGIGGYFAGEEEVIYTAS